jgi:hypothetical protein
MHSLYIFMDKFTRPILPPLFVEKDCGKYIVNNGTNDIIGKVFLVSGKPDDIFKFIDSHTKIWIGFHDTSTEKEMRLELWSQPQ